MEISYFAVLCTEKFSTNFRGPRRVFAHNAHCKCVLVVVVVKRKYRKGNMVQYYAISCT